MSSVTNYDIDKESILKSFDNQIGLNQKSQDLIECITKEKEKIKLLVGELNKLSEKTEGYKGKNFDEIIQNETLEGKKTLKDLNEFKELVEKTITEYEIVEKVYHIKNLCDGKDILCKKYEHIFEDPSLTVTDKEIGENALERLKILKNIEQEIKGKIAKKIEEDAKEAERKENELLEAQKTKEEEDAKAEEERQAEIDQKKAEEERQAEIDQKKAEEEKQAGIDQKKAEERKTAHKEDGDQVGTRRQQLIKYVNSKFKDQIKEQYINEITSFIENTSINNIQNLRNNNFKIMLNFLVNYNEAANTAKEDNEDIKKLLNNIENIDNKLKKYLNNDNITEVIQTLFGKSKQELETLNKNMENFKKELKEKLDKDIKNLSVQLEALSKATKLVDDKHDEQKIELMNTIKNLEESLKKKHDNTINEIKEKMDELQNKLDQTLKDQENIKEKEKKLKKKEEDIATLQNNLEQKEIELKKKNKELDKLNSALETKGKTSEQQKAEIEKFNEEKKKITNDTDNLKKEIETKQKEFKTKQQEIEKEKKEIQDNLNKTTSKLTNETIKLTKAQTTIEQLQQQKLSDEKKYESLQEEHDLRQTAEDCEKHRVEAEMIFDNLKMNLEEGLKSTQINGLQKKLIIVKAKEFELCHILHIHLKNLKIEKQKIRDMKDLMKEEDTLLNKIFPKKEKEEREIIGKIKEINLQDIKKNIRNFMKNNFCYLWDKDRIEEKFGIGNYLESIVEQ